MPTLTFLFDFRKEEFSVLLPAIVSSAMAISLQAIEKTHAQHSSISKKCRQLDDQQIDFFLEIGERLKENGKSLPIVSN